MSVDYEVITAADAQSAGALTVNGSVSMGLRPLYEYLLSLNSPKSRVSMLSAIKIALAQIGCTPENFDWRNLRENVVTAIVAKLGLTYAPATINNILAALKGVARRVWVNEFISTREYEMIRSIKAVRGSRLSKGRALSVQEIRSMFEKLTAEDTVRSRRDAAIFAVMSECGLRRAECASLLFENISPDPQNPCLKVIGKGNKERVSMIPQDAFKILEDWLEYRGNQSGFCFLQINKYGDILESGLTAQRIYSIAKEWEQKLNMQSWSPHDLRRTYASSLLDLGVDINTVKEMMGHSSIATTQRYDKRGNRRMREAADKLKLLS